MKDERFDVVVLGGGPAGSTAGNLLAQLGWRVLVLEKERFPRHHIGESLLPALNYLFRRLDVADRLREEKFFVKTGGSYVWGRSRKVWSIPFVPLRQALKKMPPQDVYAYHVERGRFDEILLDHCARKGAQVIQEAKVLDVALTGARVNSVRYRTKGGAERTVEAAYVVDASGQEAVLSTRLGWKVYDEKLRNMAVYTYFEGARLPPKPRDKHIFVVNVSDGWIWFIPQAGGRVSVGVVTSVDRAAEARGDHEEFLMRRVRSAPEVRRLLSGARRVEPLRVLRDWSYRSRRFAGDNFILAGDAGAFIDPLLSYGVTLAMHSAALAADCIDVALRMPERRGEVLEHFDAVHGRRFDEFLEFVKYFYDANRDRDDYFWRAKGMVDYVDNRYSRYAFTYLISGYPLWDEIPFDTKKYLGFFFGNLRVPVARLRRDRRFLDSVSRLNTLELSNIDQPFAAPAGAPDAWAKRGLPLRYD